MHMVRHAHLVNSVRAIRNWCRPSENTGLMLYEPSDGCSRDKHARKQSGQDLKVDHDPA